MTWKVIQIKIDYIYIQDKITFKNLMVQQFDNFADHYSEVCR